MATAGTTVGNNNKVSPAAAEMTDMAQKTRQGLVSSVKQGHQMSVGAAQTWVQALSVFPVQNVIKIPGVPTFANLETATNFIFDIAADLLQAQREYVLLLVNLLAPEKSV